MNYKESWYETILKYLIWGAVAIGVRLSRLRIRPVCRWFDIWVGVYVDTNRKRLYILPLPCIGVYVQWDIPNDVRF